MLPSCQKRSTAASTRTPTKGSQALTDRVATVRRSRSASPCVTRSPVAFKWCAELYSIQAEGYARSLRSAVAAFTSAVRVCRPLTTLAKKGGRSELQRRSATLVARDDDLAEEPFFTGYTDGRLKARANVTAIARHGYLTPEEQWGNVERGNPLPYTLPPDERLAAGLERKTWRLEIVADAETDTLLGAPLTKANGTAIDFDTLLKLGEQHGVRILKGVTCNNLGEPLGMGLWEGVPLRVLVWMAQPISNIRRVVYHGFHHDDPAQIFQSSLPFGRVLEEPPGELPVLVAYKLNGEFLSGKRGGPVRMAGAGGVRLQVGEVAATRRADQHVRRE